MALNKQVAEYRAEMQKLEVLKNSIIAEIKKQIAAIKENGFVTNKCTNPTVFTISSKNLSTASWDPMYYNNTALTQKMIEKIEKMDTLERVVAFISKTIETKMFEDGKEKCRCNDNFIAALQKVLNNLD